MDHHRWWRCVFVAPAEVLLVNLDLCSLHATVVKTCANRVHSVNHCSGNREPTAGDVP